MTPLNILIVAAVWLYLLPWFVACFRDHNNKWAICVLNLFLGWTFLGWVAALVWASTSDVRVSSDAP